MNRNTKLWLFALIALLLVPAALYSVVVLGYQDLQILGSPPGNPTSSYLRFYALSSGLGCKNSSGGGCLTATPSGSAGGDLSGTYPNPAVAGLMSVPFCSGFTPTNGQALEYTTGGSPNPCYTAATPGGGTTFQVNGTNLSSMSTVNYVNGTNCTITNPTAGNVSFTCTGGGGGGLTQIGQCTPGGSSATCTFSSIPNTYSNLILTYVGRTGGTGGSQFQDSVHVVLDTVSTGYTYEMTVAAGTSLSAITGGTNFGLGGWFCGNGCATGAMGSGAIRLLDYAGNGTKIGHLLQGLGYTGSNVTNLVGLAGSFNVNFTSAITQIDVTSDSGANFTSTPQTVITLYGEQ